MNTSPEYSPLSVEAQYERDYPTLLTPLVSNGRYRSDTVPLIEASIAASEANIRAVYGEDYKAADEIIYVSTISALNMRVERALEARNLFLRKAFPELFRIGDRACDGAESAYIVDILLELARGEDNLIKADEAAREMQRKLLKREPAPSLLQQLLNRLDDRTYEIAQTIHELLAEPKDAASALKFLIDNPTLGSIELANKTHPLHWSAVEPMQQMVDAAIKKHLPNAVFLGNDHSIEDNSADLEIRRIHCSDQNELQFVVVRQKHLYAYDEATGIGVPKRASYNIDLRPRPDEEGDEPHRTICELLNSMFTLQNGYVQRSTVHAKTKAHEMPREWRNKARAAEGILETILTLPPLERRRWVQPMTTSFYAANNTRLAESLRL